MTTRNVRYTVAMETETSVLSRRTWIELRVTARTHGVPVNARLPKAISRERLATQLLAGGFARAIRRLTPRQRRGLLALHAANGVLPRHRFTAHYGIIRPVRQRQPLPATTSHQKPGLNVTASLKPVNENDAQRVTRKKDALYAAAPSFVLGLLSGTYVTRCSSLVALDDCSTLFSEQRSQQRPVTLGLIFAIAAHGEVRL
jgi:hypothetical protein